MRKKIVFVSVLALVLASASFGEVIGVNPQVTGHRFSSFFAHKGRMAVFQL